MQNRNQIAERAAEIGSIYNEVGSRFESSVADFFHRDFSFVCFCFLQQTQDGGLTNHETYDIVIVDPESNFQT